MKLQNVECVLLDIEGTICPISFVKETLFPYALQALPTLLSTKWDDPSFTPYRDAFPAPARGSPAAFEAHVRALTAADVKAAPLKSLQGHLWRAGYASGAYATPLFADVEPALEAWRAAGRALAIFSSGSVEAQRLLFGYVGGGGGEGAEAAQAARARTHTRDLNGLFEAYFDTLNAGPKTERASYERIAVVLGIEVGKVLFLSDSTKEVQAALGAGMRAIIVVRPGNAPLSDSEKRFPVVESFEHIQLS